MQEASDAHSKTADSDTVSTYQVSSVQLVTDNYSYFTIGSYFRELLSDHTVYKNMQQSSL